MTIINYQKPYMIIADKNKKIRQKDDIYVPEHIDEETGELIPEHFPYYSGVWFVPDDFDFSKVDDFYVEE